jgi:predicted acetyltransferase
MPLEYAPPRDEAELRAYVDIALTALSPSPPTEAEGFERWQARWSTMGEPRLVRRDGWVAGGLCGIGMGQWFGGKSVPVSAVTAVAVAPEHRSHGAASFLMCEHLRELHAAHVPLAALYPATQPVYRHAGYERAGARIGWQLALRTIEPPEHDLSSRALTDSDRPRIREIYTQRARHCSGYFDRSEAFWALRVLSVPRGRMMAYGFERDAGLEAYIAYQHRELVGMPQYDLVVRDFGATTARGVAALTSFLTSHRSIAEHAVLYASGVDPLLFALGEQDTRAVIQRFDWLLRVVDVPRALTLRGYAPGLDATLHLDVSDDVLPANQGRFVLRVRDGSATVEPGGEGRLRIDVRGLASLFTGYATAFELALAGRAECDESTGRVASALFAGPAPGMPDMF